LISTLPTPALSSSILIGDIFLQHTATLFDFNQNQRFVIRQILIDSELTIHDSSI